MVVAEMIPPNDVAVWTCENECYAIRVTEDEITLEYSSQNMSLLQVTQDFSDRVTTEG